MKTVFTEHGWADYVYWSETDRRMVKRINRLIEDSKRDPFAGIGKPEPLKGDLSAFWSRRIDEEHRLVCRVRGDELTVVQARYHY